jgi:hypothetical protein
VSLVVACQQSGFQYWCADRTLVRVDGSMRRVVARDHRKIHSLPGRPVVLGLSGSAYDAGLILGLVKRSASGKRALVDFLALVQSAVLSVNVCSAEFGREHRLDQHLTGAVVGGMWDGEWFLRVVAPDGTEVPMMRFAAIGMAAPALDAGTLEALAGASGPFEVQAVLDRAVRTALEDEAGQLDRLVVAAGGVSPAAVSDRSRVTSSMG